MTASHYQQQDEEECVPDESYEHYSGNQWSNVRAWAGGRAAGDAAG